MIHEFDEIFVCKKYTNGEADSFLAVKSIGGGDFFFRNQDDLTGDEYKQINVVGVFTKDGRIVVSEDKYLPFTPVIKRDEEYSFQKDNDSVVLQAAKRLTQESKVNVCFLDLKLLGRVEEADSLNYVYGVEIVDAKEDFEMHIIDTNHLKIDNETPEFTKMIVSAVC